MRDGYEPDDLSDEEPSPKKLTQSREERLRREEEERKRKQEEKRKKREEDENAAKASWGNEGYDAMMYGESDEPLRESNLEEIKQYVRAKELTLSKDEDAGLPFRIEDLLNALDKDIEEQRQTTPYLENVKSSPPTPHC